MVPWSSCPRSPPWARYHVLACAILGSGRLPAVFLSPSSPVKYFSRAFSLTPGLLHYSTSVNSSSLEMTTTTCLHACLHKPCLSVCPTRVTQWPPTRKFLWKLRRPCCTHQVEPLAEEVVIQTTPLRVPCVWSFQWQFPAPRTG